MLGDVHRPAKARASAGGSGVLAQVRPLLVPPIMMAFGYFALVAASMSAVQIFAVSAMVTIYEVPLTLAAGALTVYMLGSAAGIVCGGFLAGSGFLLLAGAMHAPAATAPPDAIDPGSSDRRVALVMGNAAYKSAPLRNPANDARAMAQALRAYGFEVVHRRADYIRSAGDCIRLRRAGYPVTGTVTAREERAQQQ